MLTAPGGRRSGLARALRAHAQAELRARRDAAPTSFDETLARVATEAEVSLTLSRRDLLAAGAATGAAIWAPDGTSSRAMARLPRARAARDARVVIVGAGLAGIAAAYRLHRVGVHAEVYEARERIGGRCWTARGFADGQSGEHGGEFIDTRHVHIRQFAQELRLELDDLFKARAGSYSPNWIDGSNLRPSGIHEPMRRVAAAVAREARRIGVLRANGRVTTAPISYGTATRGAARLDQISMAEFLERHVPGVLESAVGRWLDETMASWYGMNLAELSAVNWIDYFVVPSPGADERWRVRGGNDQIVHRAADALVHGAIRVGAPLSAIHRSAGGGYRLSFEGRSGSVSADIVILTLPFTTLREVDLSRAGFSPHKLAAIRDLAMGSDSKILLQYDRRPYAMHDWSAVMTSASPDFDTWESSAAQPGTAALITVYAGGRTGRGWRAAQPHAPAHPALRDAVLARIEQAVPGSRMHFNGHAWADLWPHDRWTRGSYAAFGVGQYTRFWGGTAQPEGDVHFAGEATSTHSQGFLNGGVESGYRAAIEVMRKLRIGVPPALARLPYSPA
jgi:monoamine oxidase